MHTPRINIEVKLLLTTLLIAVTATGCATGVLGEEYNGAFWGQSRTQSRQGEAYAHYLTAIFLEEQHEDEAALYHLQQIPELDPEAVTPTLRLIRTHLRKQDYAKARVMIERALKQTPEKTNLWIVAGEIYHQLNDFDKAIAAFQRAIEINPDNVLGYGALVEIQESTNDLVAAIDIYQKLIELNPSSAGLNFQLGLNLVRINDTENAVKYLQKALQLNPNLVRAQYLLGALYLENGDNEAAIKSTEAYLQRRPTDIGATENLVAAYTRLGQYEQAMTALQPVFRSGQAEAIHHLHAMWILIQDGQYERAQRLAPPSGAPYFSTLLTTIARKAAGTPHKATLDSLATIEGDLPIETETHLNDLVILFETQDAGAWLLQQVQELQKEADTLPELQIILARLHMLMDNFEAATQRFAPVIATQPTAWLHYNVAICYEEMDDFTQAEHHLLAYLDLEPDDPDVLNFLGYLYAENGVKLDKAERLLKKALTADPANPFYLDSLGWIFYRQGKADLAIHSIQQALYKMDSDDAILRDHLGDAFRLQGDIQRAIAEWERSYRLDSSNEAVLEKIKRHQKRKPAA